MTTQTHETKPISVAIVEDDASCRKHLQELLNATPGFVCVAEFATAEEALRGWPLDPPNLAIVDLDLPGRTGEHFLRDLRFDRDRTRPVVLTAYNDPVRIAAALEAGAFGYLLKGTPAAELIASLRYARAGGAPLSPAVSLIVIGIFHRRGQISAQLSTRNFRILELLAKGFLIDEIAAEFGIAPASVRAALARIYRALQVKNSTQAVAKYHGVGPDVAG